MNNRKFNLVFLLLALTVACNKPGKNKGTASTTIDTETMTEQPCDEDEYAPVTGSYGRSYLNKCRAKKHGIQIMKDGYDAANYKKEDFLTWPIEPVCKPLAEAWDTVPPTDLEDGTLLYWNQQKQQYRGTHNKCRCLSAGTMIATPRGEVRVSDLVVGDSIYTTEYSGLKMVAAVREINKVAVEAGHVMVNFELADGRTISLTPSHPDAIKYISVNQHEIADTMDGSIITKKFYTTYEESYTYDVLPYGPSGNYWANGILIGSTMRGKYYTEDLLEMGW